MSRARRVVVTGLGMITPLGPDLPSTWEGLKAGRSGIDRIRRFDASDFAVRIAGEVKELPIERLLSRREARRLDRFAQLALVAACEAIRDSGIEFEEEDGRRRPRAVPAERIGVIYGTGVGGMDEMEQQTLRLDRKGNGQVSPFFIPKLMPNAASAQISLYWGLKGPSYSVSTACASGTHALGVALRSLALGEVDVVVAGASEAPVTPAGVSGFQNLGALSRRNDEPERASRPFDAGRDGFVVAEAAGALVLEEYERARSRGARIYAEFLGAGFTSDAFHLTAPDETGEGPARAMRLAMEDAGVTPAEVSYINAHGTSTPYNDKVETLAIKKALGEEEARRVMVSSTKSMLGHSLGATGAVEAVVCCLAIAEGVVPPTINYEDPDPDCDLDYVPNEAREAPVKVALSNSLGFGGHNATVVFGKL